MTDPVRVRAPGRRVAALRPSALFWAGIAIVIAGLNLRPSIVGVAPLTTDIRADLVATSTTIGLLTSVPLMCFAVFSPLVPRLAQPWGTARLLTIALGGLAVASLLRVVPSLPILFVATLFVGLAIAVGNVVTPAIVKQWFPEHLGTATGMYSISLFAGAALAGSTAVPLARAIPGGWNTSLASWAVLAAVGCLVWLPLARRTTGTPMVGRPAVGVWRQPLAWWVTAYMGLQSIHYFTVAAWLPEILVDAGHSRAASGVGLGTANAVAMGSALVVPIIANRVRSQAIVGVALAATAAAGLVVLELLPAAAYPAAALLGFGQGGAIGLALLLVVKRAGSTRHAIALSGMSQGVGYLFAAIGAPLIGHLHDATAAWTLPLGLLTALLVVQAVAAVVAGRSRTLA